jgi:hypothetical protein
MQHLGTTSCCMLLSDSTVHAVSYGPKSSQKNGKTENMLSEELLTEHNGTSLAVAQIMSLMFLFNKGGTQPYKSAKQNTTKMPQVRAQAEKNVKHCRLH